MSQLEIPLEAVRAARAQARFFCLNAAPARCWVPPTPWSQSPTWSSSTATNTSESSRVARWSRSRWGPKGAVLLERGEELARVTPPPVTPVDGTAAGDAFCAALVVSLLEGYERGAALARACAAGALAASRAGAQPSLPTAAEVDALLRR